MAVSLVFHQSEVKCSVLCDLCSDLDEFFCRCGGLIGIDQAIGHGVRDIQWDRDQIGMNIGINGLGEQHIRIHFAEREGVYAVVGGVHDL